MLTSVVFFEYFKLFARRVQINYCLFARRVRYVLYEYNICWAFCATRANHLFFLFKLIVSAISIGFRSVNLLCVLNGLSSVAARRVQNNRLFVLPVLILVSC